MITDKQIEDVLRGFDFYKVAEIYEKLEWKWWDKGIPNAIELRESASRKLRDLQERYPEVSSIESGGLRAKAYEEVLDDENPDYTITVLKLEFIAHSSLA